MWSQAPPKPGLQAFNSSLVGDSLGLGQTSLGRTLAVGLNHIHIALVNVGVVTSVK